MGKKQSIQEEINSFLEYWDYNKQVAFLRDIIPLFELYDVEDEDDWVEKETGGDFEHVRTVRLVRTVYLMSKIAENHSGHFATIRAKFAKLCSRMEKHNLENGEEK